jgi:hypothetical protein
VSSTENAASPSQLPPPESTGSEAVTPDAGTPAAPVPGDAAPAEPTAGTAEQPPTEPAAAEEPATVEQPAAAGSPVTGTPTAETPAVGGQAADQAAPQPSPVPAPPAAPVSDPAQWGRVDEEGTVFVRTAEGERAVGSWQAGEPAAGLAHYARRYDDLATEVGLLEARLRAHTGNPSEIKAKAQALADSIPTATAVGDLDGLAARARAMVGAADSAVAESRAEKAAQRAAQVARKEALAAEAEQIAAESTSWKAAGRPAQGHRRGVEDHPRHRPQDRRGAVEPVRRRP